MKRFVCSAAICLMILAVTQGLSLAATTWEKSFGGLDFTSFSKTTDDGSVFTATNYVHSAESREASIVKLDQNGSIEWSKNVPSYNMREKILQISDGGFIFVGTDQNILNYSTKGDLKIIKFDPVGNIIWEKKIGTSQADRPITLNKTLDGGFIVGSQSSNFPYYMDITIYKFDSNGNVLWHYYINNDIYDQLRDVERLADGSVVVLFVSHRGQGGKHNIIKFDSAGTQIYSSFIEGPNPHYNQSLIPTSDAGFIKVNPDATYKGATLTKFDKEGSVVWNSTYIPADNVNGGFIDGIPEIDENGDDVGYVLSSSQGILKIDLAGEILWQKPHRASSFKPDVMYQTNDGGFVFPTIRKDFIARMNKIDNNGELESCSIDPDPVSTIIKTTETSPIYLEYVQNYHQPALYVEATTTNIFPSRFVDYAYCTNEYGTPYFTPEGVSFGVIELNTTSEKQFDITNIGTTPLVITAIYPFNPDPAFVDSNNCPDILLQNQSCTVSVAFTPTSESRFISRIRIGTVNTEHYITLTGNGVDSDRDDDGYERPADCDDYNSAVNPGMIEIPYNGLDDDCSDITYDDDLDRDDYGVAEDCNDEVATINPGEEEIPYNGIDENCSDMTDDDDVDTDGYGIAEDCNDNDSSIYPGQTEIKHDGVDQDCNGYDLTIDITSAIYNEKDSLLTVKATSSWGETANLEVLGYGAMTWKDGQMSWKYDFEGANPGTVSVVGPEGSQTVNVIDELK